MPVGAGSPVKATGERWTNPLHEFLSHPARHGSPGPWGNQVTLLSSDYGFI